MSKQKITGIILAGGKSRRMGAEKGLLRLSGKFMIEYSINILNQVCDKIIISENSNAYDFLGYPVVADIFPNSGPMGGIYSAMKHSDTELNLVLSCDMPFITKEMLCFLIDNISNHEVAVPWYGDQKFEPMCAVYHQKVIPVFEKFIQSNNFKIPDAFKQVKTNKIQMSDDLEVYNPQLFENINSKIELQRALKILDDRLPTLDRLLLIAGTGRNVGKTTLACELIQEISKKKEVVGIKISPHIHSQNEGGELVAETDHYSIYREQDKNKEYDSSRMLKAGAKKVFYIQSEDHKVYEAFEQLLPELDENIAIVCESGGLRNYVKPSLFLMCKRKGEEIQKEKAKILLPKADKLFEFSTNNFDTNTSLIIYNGLKWIISEV